MTYLEEPIKTEPIVINNAVLYLSDLEVELSDNDSAYTEICFCGDLDFDPYFEDSDDDSDDETDAKIFPSEK